VLFCQLRTQARDCNLGVVAAVDLGAETRGLDFDHNAAERVDAVAGRPFGRGGAALGGDAM
jgi:hypothetical protein